MIIKLAMNTLQVTFVYYQTNNCISSLFAFLNFSFSSSLSPLNLKSATLNYSSPLIKSTISWYFSLLEETYKCVRCLSLIRLGTDYPVIKFEVKSRYLSCSIFMSSRVDSSSSWLLDSESWVTVSNLDMYWQQPDVSLLDRRSKYLSYFKFEIFSIPLLVIEFLLRKSLANPHKFSQISCAPTSVILLSPRIRFLIFLFPIMSLICSSVTPSAARSI